MHLGARRCGRWASRPNRKKQFHDAQACINHSAPRRHMTWLPCQISILSICYFCWCGWKIPCRVAGLVLLISYLLDLGLASTLATTSALEVAEKTKEWEQPCSTLVDSQPDKHLQQRWTRWPSDKDIVFDNLRPSYFGERQREADVVRGFISGGSGLVHGSKRAMAELLSRSAQPHLRCLSQLQPTHRPYAR